VSFYLKCCIRHFLFSKDNRRNTEAGEGHRAPSSYEGYEIEIPLFCRLDSFWVWSEGVSAISSYLPSPVLVYILDLVGMVSCKNEKSAILLVEDVYCTVPGMLYREVALREALGVLVL
jgi:hypothetical protein